MKAYVITIRPHAITVNREYDSPSLVLCCPFCIRSGDSRPWDPDVFNDMTFNGACGPWCPHFGTPYQLPCGEWVIDLTCGKDAKLKTRYLRKED